MKISSYAYTALAFTSLATSAYAGCSQKTDMEVCITTDSYPRETKLVVDDIDGKQRLEMNGLSKRDKTYCDDVRLCPGWHTLTVEDDACDGLGHSSGRVTVRPVGHGKIVNEYLSNFGCNYGVSFRAPYSTSSTTTTTNNNNIRGSSGPFGSRNCSECKDECERRNRGDSWGKKRCKTDRCRAHFGKKPCKD